MIAELKTRSTGDDDIVALFVKRQFIYDGALYLLCLIDRY